MMRSYIPEQPIMESWEIKAEYDRLYLEKCQEVNELEEKVEKYKSMAEIAVKQKAELRVQFKEQLEEQRKRLEEAKQTIRELAAEQLPFGFIPDVEAPEELPEELMEELPLWALQPVTAQDILCLSSALKNLYDIHKCDSWLLYTKLCKVLEKKIDAYSAEEG